MYAFRVARDEDPRADLPALHLEYTADAGPQDELWLLDARCTTLVPPSGNPPQQSLNKGGRTCV